MVLSYQCSPLHQDIALFPVVYQISRAAGLAFPVRGGVPIMLADEARSYFDEAGRLEREALDPLIRVGFSCESLKVTTLG